MCCCFKAGCNPRLVVYDYNALIFIAGKYPRLAAELESLAREVLVTTVDLTDIPDNVDLFPTSTELLDTEVLHYEPPPFEPAHPLPGAILCQDILAVKKGRPGAREFEKRVEEALKYIFETDLSAWSSQKTTHGGLSRYDLIARITSSHDIWRMLVERFHSQYIIFEF